MTQSLRPLLDAKDLQAEYGLNRRQAYELLHDVGVRITPRRLVVLRSRLEQHLAGGYVMTDGNGRGPYGGRDRQVSRKVAGVLARKGAP